MKNNLQESRTSHILGPLVSCHFAFSRTHGAHEGSRAHARRPSLNCILELAIRALKPIFSSFATQRERYEENAKNNAHSIEIKISLGNEVRVDQTHR